MASIISHPAIPLAIGIGLGSGTISRRLLVAGVVFSIVPDLDVYLQNYTSAIGHRGATHSIFFAVLCAVAAAAIAPALRSPRLVAFWFVGVATASHGLLDAFTNGGPGIAFLWPFTHERYFMPVRPILVSPLSISRFMSDRGLAILASELKWVWAPALMLGLLIYGLSRHRSRTARDAVRRA
jgi:inner membrane protein